MEKIAIRNENNDMKSVGKKFALIFIELCLFVIAIGAQEKPASSTFELSKHVNNKMDSSYISLAASTIPGKKANIKVSAWNKNILSLYQAIYEFPYDKFIFSNDLSYIKSNTQTYDLEFSGDKETLIKKLDTTFKLKTEKIITDSVILMIIKIEKSQSIRPIKQQKSFVRQFKTAEANHTIKSIKGELTSKELIDFMSKELNCSLSIDKSMENQWYKVNFSFNKNTSIDNLLAFFRSIGIYIEKKNKKIEFVRITKVIIYT